MPSPLPYMQFFPKDWVFSSTVTRMPLEAQGAFIRLLCFQWEEGHIDDDQEGIAALLGISMERLATLWKHIERAFPLAEDGHRYNPRCAADRIAAFEKGEKARAAGSKGGRSHPGAKHTPSEPKAGAPPEQKQTPSERLADALPIATADVEQNISYSDSDTDTDKRSKDLLKESDEKSEKPPRVKRLKPELSADQWNEFWGRFIDVYPKRDGGLDAADGYSKFKTLVSGGVDPEEIIAGAARYKAWCQATGKVKTSFVKTIPTFMNKRSWQDDYEIQAPGTSIVPSESVTDKARRMLEELG